MLNFIATAIFYGILCLHGCSSSEQMCDVERWLSDNEVTVNRLDVSNYAKSRLAKSLQSPDKLLSCSFLRAVHKEAELELKFKQNRYKVNSRELKARQEERLDGAREGEDGSKEDDREKREAAREATNDDKLLDAVDDASSDRGSLMDLDADARPQSFEPSVDGIRSQGESTNPDAFVNLPPDQSGQNQGHANQQQEKEQNEEQLREKERADLQRKEEEDKANQLENEQKEQPKQEQEHQKLELEQSQTELQQEEEHKLQKPELDHDAEEKGDPAREKTVDTMSIDGHNRLATSDGAPTSEQTVNLTSLPPPSTESPELKGRNHTEGNRTATTGSQNSGFDLSDGTQNRTVNLTKNELTTVKCLLEKCSTTSANLTERSTSLKLCRIVQKDSSSQSKKQSEMKTNAPGPSIVTICTTTQRRQAKNRFSSMYFCECFFPITSQGRSLNSTNNTILTVTHPMNSTIDKDSKNNRTLTKAFNFSHECLQCLAKRLNRTQSFCIFASQQFSRRKADETLSDGTQHQQQLLVDKLQFIGDQEGSSVHSSLVAAAAAEPMTGGELQETELPTRARQDVQSKQIHNVTNQTIQATSDSEQAEQKSASNASSAQPVHVDANESTSTIAKKLELLSHSVFMEKLFDDMLSRHIAKDSVHSTANMSLMIDSIKHQLDGVVRETAVGRNEQSNIKSHLNEVDSRLSRMLIQMNRLNRQLIKRIQALEVTALGRVAACEQKLNESRQSYESLARRSNSQVSRLELKIRRLASQVQRVRPNSCNCKPDSSSPLPPIQPMAQEPLHNSAGHHHHQQQQQQHLLHEQRRHYLPNAATAIMPDGIEDCSDFYAKKTVKQQPTDSVFTANLGPDLSALKVRCDMRHGGWTYILSRSNGETDFFRNWTAYQNGFGDPSGEHFIGLNALAEMTSRRPYKLWVVLEDWEGNVKHVSYDDFIVSGNKYNYQLHVDRFRGDESVGDSLSSHSNSSFSTFDSDHDLVDKKFGGNCAKRFRGGFWYFSCYRANPTGKYYPGGSIPDRRCDGIVWKTWKGPHYSLKSIHMKIRPL